MALVAGVVFFVLRAVFALIPGLASARPIKKWSAVGALIAAFGYLLLSGSEVATQRSFIMTAIVLIGVMADRPALTLRTLAMAAFMGCCCSRRSRSCIRASRCRFRRRWR
jgi:competence protein ComEC